MKPLIINIVSDGSVMQGAKIYAKIKKANESGRPVIINIDSSTATCASFANRNPFLN